MSNYCEIIDKNTGDKVNLAAGFMFWAGFAALSALLIGRGCQEVKKHSEKSQVPNVQVVTNAVQFVR